ncbi:four helix bundle protein [Candidatus Saccharibacteria bacterium]|nr:four helix bundle protein [Candidatus Saccharibacteria bacterium]
MDDLPLITKTEELYGASLRVCEKLSGLQRQTLGRRLEDAILSLLEYEIMAKNAPRPNKAPYLIKACALQEVIMIFLRLMINQNLANQTTLHQLQARTLEIGRMLGGWRKSIG